MTPSARLRRALDERDVGLLDGAVLELLREGVVRGVVLRDEDDARRVAVEPVDDAGAQHAADAGEIGAVREDRVDERAGRVAGRRMHRHAGRLVDDEHVGVLEQDVERDVLGDRGRFFGRRDIDAHALAGIEPQRCLRAVAFEQDVALVDQLLHAGAGERRDQRARRRRRAARLPPRLRAQSLAAASVPSSRGVSGVWRSTRPRTPGAGRRSARRRCSWRCWRPRR